MENVRFVQRYMRRKIIPIVNGDGKEGFRIKASGLRLKD
jgi:hypothetical protein